jgi:flavin reductase (DIM6/NTAB) family NADH-FMN oxidoreductase RutF
MEYIVQGANVIAFNKEGHKYAMTCAWTTHVDYEKIMMLIGSQSYTGKALKVGDIVGVSALAKGQGKEAVHFGSKHSNTFDKFKDYKYEEDGSAILIPNAKNKLVCRVEDITHVKDDPDDLLVLLTVLKHQENKDASFLIFQDLNY